MIRKHLGKPLAGFVAALLLIAVAASAGYSGQPVIWETSGRAELLKGRRARCVHQRHRHVDAGAASHRNIQHGAGICVVERGGQPGQCLSGHRSRWKNLSRFIPMGRGSLLYDAAELDVTALAVARDGAVYAGTSPDGKVYRITSDGHAEVYFDPGDKYIWSLAVLADGSLAVGTGDNGKLYRVRAAGAKPESSLLIATNQTHVMSLAVTAQGDLIAGTDPGGLVLRISPEGQSVRFVRRTSARDSRVGSGGRWIDLRAGPQ